MNNFIYDIPVKVYFGQNQLSHLGEELSRYGTRVLLTYGGGSIKKSGLYDKVIAEIERAGRCTNVQRPQHRRTSRRWRRLYPRRNKIHGCRCMC